MKIHDLKNCKLLIITNSYPDKNLNTFGGIFVKDQVDELSKYFEEIYIVSPQPFGINRALFDYDYKNIRVFFPRFFHLPTSYFRKRLGNSFFKATMKMIKREKLKFDLVHAHFTWPSGYAGVKLAKEFEVPVVITIHENRDWFLKEYNSRNEEIYWTWKNADALIRVNKKDVPLLKELNSNVYSIPNGFNPNRLKIIERKVARVKLGFEDDVKIVFSLGALIERKGFHYLIDAMYLVTKKRKDIMCFIGGSGPLKKKLQQQINRLRLQKHVKLLGYVPDNQLVLWMNAADLFVLPSLNEGNPTVMFEALGVGLPFIGTTVGGVPEVITSEDYGLLCPPADSECLAEKILIALEKEWDREKISEYARKFTWENVAKRILEVYKSVV